MSDASLALAVAASLMFTGHASAGVPTPCRPMLCSDAPAMPPTGSKTGRAAFTAAMAQDWPAARRRAFARLLTAEAAFAAAVGTNETDGGTLAAGEATMAREAEHAAFLHTLDAVAHGRTTIAFVEYAASDAALNASYRQVMAVDDPAALSWGSVDKAGIRTTQRAWLAYRDAFTAFAATYDATTAAAVTAELTTRRTIRLEGFLGD